jgi:hypothetical protein
MMSVMKKYPFCIPFIVYIKNKDKHKERFAVRSKHMTLEPKYNKYVACFDNIRTIHKHFVKKAEKRLIPRIDNTNVDKSLGIIHSTIIRCLRKIMAGESLMDEETNKATVLCQEFNVVTKSGLSSAEAQKVIMSKVNKGEIFKRFFGDQNEIVSPDHPIEDAGELKRVHSFDENEIEQMKKESESNQNPTEEAETEFDPLHRLIAKPKNEDTNEFNSCSKLNIRVLKTSVTIPEGSSLVENNKNAEGGQGTEKEEVKKPLKTSKSSENLLDKAKKQKKRFANRFAFRNFKREDQDSTPIDEDKQSLMSGLCSVYSGSIDVANYSNLIVNPSKNGRCGITFGRRVRRLR